MSVWTILFDIDGTLMTSSSAGMGAMERTVGELYGIDQVPNVSVHGRTDNAILHELFEAIEIEPGGSFDAFNACYLSHLPQTLHEGNGRLLPGVASLLETLASMENVALGLLTGNLKAAAEIKLQHVGVASYFDFGGFGDLHADRNDVAAEAVGNAKIHLGDRYCPNQTWVIGDTPNDVRCGRHIGAKVMAVETGGASGNALATATPDLQLANLCNVDSWIESLV